MKLPDWAGRVWPTPLAGADCPPVADHPGADHRNI